MATGRVANAIWGMTADPSNLQLRSDWQNHADFFHRKAFVFAPSPGVVALGVGVGQNIDWAYRVLDYVQPVPDPTSNSGAYRPVKGQLSP